MSNKAWGGRFETQPEEWVDDFNASIDFDKNLIKQDVQGSIAHATMPVSYTHLTLPTICSV